MDKIKKVFLFAIPVSICNFRCHYCYLAQRDESFQGLHPEMKYSPEKFGHAMNANRVGGTAYANFCADGETLLVRDIDLYVKAFIQQGHYAEVVSNMSVTTVIDKFLSWDKDLLSHLEFKCSFHYLELKKKGLLDTFAANVKRVWDAGASATIEITPSDELVPYIDEVIAFSMENFGALPHLTIARNDRTSTIDYLTNLDMDEYARVWSQFRSDFWEYKRTIFGVKQKDFCYAGAWSLHINLCTGDARSCYHSASLGDVFADPSKPFPTEAVGACPIAHCYNGHALLTLGLIPHSTNVRYGNIRNRIRTDGGEWLHPVLKSFFNTQLIETNRRYSKPKQLLHNLRLYYRNPNNRNNTIHCLKKFPNYLTRKILGDTRYESFKKHMKGD